MAISLLAESPTRQSPRLVRKSSTIRAVVPEKTSPASPNWDSQGADRKAPPQPLAPHPSMRAYREGVCLFKIEHFGENATSHREPKEIDVNWHAEWQRQEKARRAGAVM